MGECAAQPASVRRSAIEYNETVFAVLFADEIMCNVQRKPETNVVRSQNGLQAAVVARRSIKRAPKRVSCKGLNMLHTAYCGVQMRCCTPMLRELMLDVTDN